MSLAPIVLFCYNRAESTFNTLEALAKNDLAADSILIVYCDGPKLGASGDDLKAIEAVRELVDKEDRFKEVRKIKRARNVGLSESIITGVSEVMNEFGSAIVLEDDILCSNYFLSFMNEALVKYKDNSKVFSIGACNYFAIGDDIPECFALPVADCWGWATWEDRWAMFERNSQKLLDEIIAKSLTTEFSLLGYYDFFGMLNRQNEGSINSWAIRWQAVIYLKSMLTIYPNPSLTQHIESLNATHAGINVRPLLADRKIVIDDKPILLDRRIFKKLLRGYYSQLSPSSSRRWILSRIFNLKALFTKDIKKYVDTINSN